MVNVKQYCVRKSWVKKCFPKSILKRLTVKPFSESHLVQFPMGFSAECEPRFTFAVVVVVIEEEKNSELLCNPRWIHENPQWGPSWRK